MTANSAASSRFWGTWLFHPFRYVAGGVSLAAGLPIILVASLNGALTQSHFDGVLDFHAGAATPIWFYVAEGLVNWFVMGALLYVAGRLISSSRIRAIDVFGTQALARTPALAMPFLVMLPGFQEQTFRLLAMDHSLHLGDVAGFAVAMLGIVLAMVWMVLLMYRAFAVSCNVGGGRAIGTFIAALFLGEVISKAIIVALFAYARGF